MRAHADVVAEVKALPEGPQIGAYFDFDGTIIAGYSATAVLREQIRRRELSVRQIVESARAMAAFGIGNTSFSTLMMATTQFMRGIDEAAYRERANKLFEKDIARLIYPESRALIEAHLRKGHTVAIVSSATVYQVEPAARTLNIPHVRCSRLAVADGKFTGDVVEPACFGQGKVLAAESLAQEYGVDLAASFFYTDSDDDIELLERVGNPRPTNPNRALSAIARKRGWPTRRFTSRGRPKVSEWLRSILATASMVSSAAAALPIWALTGSKRDAQNFTSSLFAETASALIGMTLKVHGEENLWKQRPAIFVFNHQSKADFIIIAKLLRRDFAGVARKHGKGLPLFNQAMELGGVVLIDLEQPKEAVATMRALADSVKEQGISVAIAPEGTRSTSTRLGAFKKGPFQLAIQSRAPIVPIVIHNAFDVAPKGEFVYRSGTVHIDVLAPVETRTWKKQSIDRHMADIRRQFLATLGQADV